jgi:DNA primase
LGQKTLEYLKDQRGLSEEVLKKFQVGYCPPQVDHDLRGRIIMPLFDATGTEVVAFTSRDPNAPKRFQHWHEQFEKSRYLYGFHLAKDAIRRRNKAILVEGQFDTMCLHTYGFDVTVGLCGHSLSIMQVNQLVRYCSEIYLLLDPDGAGGDAIASAMELYEKYDLVDCGVLFVPVFLPDGLDPDDFVMKKGTNALVELLRESKQRITHA